MKLRQLTGKELPYGENTEFSVRLFSPYMTFNDFRWFFAPLFSFNKFIGIQHKLYETLYSESGLSGYDYTHYKVPVVIAAGDSDWITPFNMARDYFDNITAPEKDFIIIENAGHIPFKPGRFTEALQNILNRML